MRTTESQRSVWAVALIIAIVIAAVAGFWMGTRQMPSASAPATSVAVAPNTEAARIDASGRKVLYWHDPMYPGQRFDKPGKSPFMDMDLVPVYADAGTDEGSVSISSRLAQNLGMRTVAAKEGSLEMGFTAVGTVTIDERLIVAVQSRSSGYVEKLHVRAQYDEVTAGQPLIDLYVPEWLAAEEEWLVLRSSKQPGAQELADAARHRLELLGAPKAEVERVAREGRPVARVTIPAPESGIVWEIGARQGQSVTPGTTLFKLAGLGTVWVTADVPEAQGALVRVGGPVEARATAYPNRVFKGTVNALLPELNAATRSVRARIVLSNPDRTLKPGMFANVAFGGQSSRSLVLVPAEAVIRTGKRNVVIVAGADGKFTPVEVEIGRESGDMSEIRKGLTAGQKVVVSGQFLVDSEASLRGALARLESKQSGTPITQPAPATAALHKAEGVVRAVGDEVTIKHGAIPSAGMGAMTMAFKPPKDGLPPDIKPGVNVRFQFTLTPQGEMQLRSIVVADAAAQTGIKK
jgi:Cu(I)/Ag(I) efflux system membrane fusion protein